MKERHSKTKPVGQKADWKFRLELLSFALALACGIMVVSDLVYFSRPKATGTITAVTYSKHMRPVDDSNEFATIRFEANGHHYTAYVDAGKFSYWLGYYNEGDEVRVAYSRKRPDKNISYRKPIRPLITLIVFLLALSFFLGIMWRDERKEKRRKKQEGLSKDMRKDL